MCGYFCIWFIDFMFKRESLTGLTNLFSSHDFEKSGKVILNIFWKKIWSSMKHIFVTPNNFIFNKIMLCNSDSIHWKKYIFFIAEISDREKMSIALDKYITVLDYADKTLLFLSDAGGGVSLFSFNIVIGKPVWDSKC